MENGSPSLHSGDPKDASRSYLIRLLTARAHGSANDNLEHEIAQKLAQKQWDRIKNFPLLAFTGLVVLSIICKQMWFGNGVPSDLAIVIFIICTIILMGWLNKIVHAAFIKMEMAFGASKQQANATYDHRFNIDT